MTDDSWLTSFTRQLRTEGDLCNAFGATREGDMLVRASRAISSLRWTVAELVDLLDALRELAAAGDTLDAELAEQIRETVTLARTEMT